MTHTLGVQARAVDLSRFDIDSSAVQVAAPSGISYLNGFSLMSTLSSVLPVGLSSQDYNVTVIVAVQDGFGAKSRATTRVQVMPYRPPANVPFNDAAEESLSAAAASGSAEAVEAVVTSLAASLKRRPGRHQLHVCRSGGGLHD